LTGPLVSPGSILEIGGGAYNAVIVCSNTLNNRMQVLKDQIFKLQPHDTAPVLQVFDPCVPEQSLPYFIFYRINISNAGYARNPNFK
jgi:hypothetical protein